MERDCLFIGMRHQFLEIPKEKKFLLKYFRGKFQRQFLRYFIFFGDYENFVDHTGFCCSKRWLKNLEKKYNDLIYMQNTSRSNIDLDRLTEIESGKINFTRGVKNKYI